MDRERLETVRPVLQEAVDQGDVAGVCVLVWQGGREQFYGSAGYADLAGRKDLQRDTIYRLFSMTKPVTGAACMLLMERGQLDLLAPVSRYLPGFRDQKVAGPMGPEPVRREMKVSDLLSMTSGMPYGGQNSLAELAVDEVFREEEKRAGSPNPMGTVEMANRLGACPLAFHPGEDWLYGTSADIVGAMIEVISGKRYGQFLQEEFFGPLGMKDTGFSLSDGQLPRLSKAYCAVDGGLEEYMEDHRADVPPAYEAGGAGLYSTVDDYLRFTRMLLGGGEVDGVRILSPGTVNYFTAPQLTTAQMETLHRWENLSGFSYGKFLRVLVEPGKAVISGSKGEYGWDGWMGTYFTNAPTEDLSMLFMIQKADAGTTELTRRVHNMVFAAL